MKRHFLTLSRYACLLAVTFAVVPAMAQAAKKKDAAQLPSATVTGSCTVAKPKLTATSTMRPIPGTAGEEVNFLLQRKLSGQNAFHYFKIPGLGRGPKFWFPAPQVGQAPPDVWHVQRTVDLRAGASAISYRLDVQLRWLGADGTVLKQKRLFSPACTIPKAADGQTTTTANVRLARSEQGPGQAS